MKFEELKEKLEKMEEVIFEKIKEKIEKDENLIKEIKLEHVNVLKSFIDDSNIEKGIFKIGDKNKNDSKIRFKGYSVLYDELESLTFLYSVKNPERDEWFSGDLVISFVHYSDCCEQNYADPSYFENSETPIKHLSSNEFNLELIDEVGFRINTHLIPCYSVQNGYYSSKLNIYIEFKDLHDETSYYKNKMIFNCEYVNG